MNNKIKINELWSMLDEVVSILSIIAFVHKISINEYLRDFLRQIYRLDSFEQREYYINNIDIIISKLDKSNNN